MKKLTCILLVLVLALASTVCFADSIYQAGTYTAAARGNNGDVNVSVIFTDSAIATVEITAHSETVGISDPAIERIPAAIVAGQTLAVDTVSGATNTSKAILSAVTDCVKQAGGDVNALLVKAEVENAEKPVEQLSCDIVVVGSGLSGMSSAVAASENGASVIVLEKMAVTGGSAKSSQGTFMTCEVPENKDDHVTQSDDTLEAALGRWKDSMDKSVKPSQYPDYNRLSTMLVRSMGTIRWLQDEGVSFHSRDGFTIAERGMNALQADVAEDTQGTGAGKLMRLLEKKAVENGAVVYVETPATELILDGDKVIGVKASGIDSEYEITAKRVILACGGFGSNPELVAEFAPEFVKIGYSCQGVPGNTGDGITMALAAGAVTYEDNWVLHSYISPSTTLLTHNSMFLKFLELNGLADPESSYDRLMVDCAGNRFMNEAAHYSIQNMTMVSHGKAPYYALYDGVAPEIAEILETGIETGDVIKGATITELAQNAGMDPAVLEATVARYTQLAQAGNDEDFGKKAERMNPIAQEGPYYLVRFVGAFSGTLGGVKTNDNFQAIRADGSVIDGLYAVGEMANRFCYNQMYFSGSSLTFSATMGRIAGAHAAGNM